MFVYLYTMADPSETIEPTLIRPAITATPFVVTGRLLDQVPRVGQPFAQAFSVRRIYTNYTGPCMRVRRSSDGAELDIGFVQTTLDVTLLERHCAGFDGFVSVWYDQTGRGFHAKQREWRAQPRIVRRGKVIRDTLGNYAMEFNGSYLDTAWEPAASEVGAATGTMFVASAGLGDQGQVGVVESSAFDVSTPLDVDTFPEYPNAKVPQGYDTFLLDSTELSEEDFERRFVYHGKDKRVYVYDVLADQIEATGRTPPQGPTLVSAELVRVDGEDSTVEDARANAPVANTAWGKAVEGKDGRVYGIPMRANRILRIDPAPEDPDQRAELLDIAGQTREESNKWITGIYSESMGCIVCPPYNPVDGEARWLIIDTDESRTTYGQSKLIGQGTGSNLYRDVALDADGRAYAAPFNTSVLTRLNLAGVNDYESIDGNLIETRTLPGTRGSRNLYANLVTAENDRLYMTPWDAGAVIEIEPRAVFAEDVLRARGNFGIDLERDRRGEGYFQAPTVRLRNPELFTEGVTNASSSDDLSNLSVSTSLSLTRFVTGVTVATPGTGYLGSSWPSLSVSIGSAISNPSFGFTMEPKTVNGIYRGYGLKQITVNNMGNGLSGAPSLSFSGTKGRNAVLRAVWDPTDPQGRITMLEVIDGGSGFFYGPYPGDEEAFDISIAIDPPYPGAPSSQRATGRIVSWTLTDPNDDPNQPLNGWSLEEIILTNRGENYIRSPNARLQGNNLRGENVGGISVQTSGDHHIQQINVSDGGSGFRVEPAYSVNDSYWTSNDQVLLVSNPNTTLSTSGATRAIVRIAKINANGTIIDDPGSSESGSIEEIEIIESGRGYHPNDSEVTLSVRSNDYWDGSEAPTLTPVLRPHGRITGISQVDVTNVPDLGYLYPPGLVEVPGFRRVGSESNATYNSFLRPPGDDTEATSARWIGAIYSSGQGTVTCAPYNSRRSYRILNTGASATNPPSLQLLTDASGVDVRTIDGGAKFNDLRLDASGQFAFCAPRAVRRVLRIDLSQGTADFVGPNVRGIYATLVRSTNGILYGFPSSSVDVLVIDPTNPRDIDELRFGNLNFPGRKFASALVLERGSSAGLLYAIPDQIPVSIELNPGVPLPRTPSLPPPSVRIRVGRALSLGNPQSSIAEYEAVVYGPTPEQTTPALRVVVFAQGDGLDYETLDLPIQPTANERVPWFGEAVVCTNEPNPTLVFVPFYNVNSEYTWDEQSRVMMVYMDDVRTITRTYLETLLETGSRQQAVANLTSPTHWWSSRMPRELVPPYPSRTVVSIPRLGETVVGWVPKGAGADPDTSTETFVTYRFKTSPADEETVEALTTSRGNHLENIGTSNPNGKRTFERVSWALAGITDPNSETRGALVTVSYASPPRAEDAPGIQINARNRHTRGVYVDGTIYAAPRGRNEFYRYDVATGETVRENWADEFSGLGFSSSTSNQRRGSRSGTNRYSDVVYIPQTDEIYCIPENARAFTVYSLETGDRFSFGQFDLEEGTGLTNAKFSMATYTVNNKIVCLPMNHTTLVFIDPLQTNFLERLDFSVTYPTPNGWDLEGDANWYRYAVALEGSIYCIPWSARQILRIDPRTKAVAFVGDILDGAWGQGTLHPDGKVYCAPVNSRKVLRFYVDETTGSFVTDLLDVDIPANGGLEGSALGSDGLIYFAPRNQSGRSVLAYDPATNIVSSVGSLRLGSRQERDERWQNIVQLEDQRMIAVPSSVRTFAEIAPNSSLFRTYDARTNFANFNQRAWFNEPLFVQREFRLAPKRVLRPRFGSEPVPYLVFANDRGYSIYDMGVPDPETDLPPVLALSPPFENGMNGFFGDPGTEQNLITIAFRNGDQQTYGRTGARMLDGALAGIRSVQGTSNLYSAIESNDLVGYVGDGEIRIRGMFNVVFQARETGAFSIFATGGRDNQVPANGQLTTYIRGVSLGQRPYTWDGNASGGSTFEIGRVFLPLTQEQTGYFGTFTGKLQELVVFRSNQLSRVRTLAENQTFAYNV